MHPCRWAVGGAVALMLLTSGLHHSATADNTPAGKPNATEKADAAGEVVYKLKEVPTFNRRNYAQHRLSDVAA